MLKDVLFENFECVIMGVHNPVTGQRERFTPLIRTTGELKLFEGHGQSSQITYPLLTNDC